MEKNNNSLLLSILGGVVTCFICVGLVFLFPSKGSKKLNGNNTSLPNQIVDLNSDEEIALGDDTCATWNYSAWERDDSGNGAWTCAVPSGIDGAPPASAGGTTWHGIETGNNSNCSQPCNNPCYRTTTYKRHTTTCASYSACDAGKYLEDGQCKTCPAGYTSAAGATAQNQCYITVGAGLKLTGANASTTAPCDAGTAAPLSRKVYYGSDGACSACSGANQYSYAGATECLTCESGNATSSHDGCQNAPSSGCGAGQYRGATSCLYCEAGYKCPNSMSRVACSGATEYQDETGQTYCKTCPSGKTPNTSHTACITIPSGGCNSTQYVNDSGVCTNCPAGSYCNGVTKTACPAGKSSLANSTSYQDCSTCAAGLISEAGGTCHACTGENKTSNSDHTSCVCKEGYILRGSVCTQIDYSQCSVSASTTSIVTSVDVDDVDNSYYTVTVTVSGTFCTGQTLTYSATNAKSVSPTSQTITSNSSTATYTFKVYPKNPCYSSVATAKLDKNGKSASTKSVILRTDWKKTEGVCEKNPTYTSFEAADAAGANVYYTNNGTCADGTSGYTVKWTRSGCGGGGGKVPYCYIDDDGEYQWTDSPKSTWKKVEGITSSANCKKDEEPACYLSPEKEYKWGLYATKDGYTLITSIKEESKCTTPKEEEACYRNSAGDYMWTTTAPDGYTKVDEIKTPEECAPPEEPGCYIHDNEFVWGMYERVTGYIRMADITTEDQCKAPDSDACYKAPNGEYVWGKYGSDPNYTLIPSITDVSNCKADVPVPPTSANVSKLVYVFMAILMACGIGFIYYSSVVKKNNN